MYAPKEGTRGGIEIATLIAILEDMRAQHGDETLVRIMSQENYPFEHGIAGVVDSTEFGDNSDDPDDYRPEDLTSEGEVPICVYIVEGSQIGYGNRDAWSNPRRWA